MDAKRSLLGAITSGATQGKVARLPGLLSYVDFQYNSNIDYNYSGGGRETAAPDQIARYPRYFPPFLYAALAVCKRCLHSCY
jgi:hypothetical protein